MFQATDVYTEKKGSNSESFVLEADVNNSDDSIQNSEERDSDTTSESVLSDMSLISGDSRSGESIPSAPLIYVLVSIMSAQYQNLSPLKEMMLEIHKRYGNSEIPIVYVCGDTVYNITKPFLFKDNVKKDPVKKGRDAWLDRHNEAIDLLQSEENLQLNHQIVYWDTVKQAADYASIRKFTDAVFNRKLTLEELQKSFPEADTDSLRMLLEDRRSTKILENVPIIAQEFSSKNLNKLEKQAKAKTKKVNNLISDLEETGIPLVPPKIHKNNLKLNTLKDGLLLATHEYLSEEFSLFLLLSFLQYAPAIKAGLDLKLAAFDTSSKFQPILSYPISKGNDIIFCTFRMVEALYNKYFALLDLPKIEQQVTIFDPFTPEIPYSKYTLPINTESSVNGSDNSSQNINDGNDSQDNIAIESNKSGTEAHDPEKSMSIYSAQNSLTTFKFSQASSHDVTNEMILEIVREIEMHLKLTAEIKTETVYGDHIICEITSSSRLDLGKDQDIPLNEIFMLVKLSVTSIKQNNKKSISFNSGNRTLNFVVKAIAPSPSVLQTTAPAMRK